ncbi:hypothetical protein HMPREF9193_00972 [Treponema lecithinolyticum ATCC 700332]|uniref:Uncharacterized protein n=1 Tax=Treponema lecithinolyticum ATCC 700332 TaxID=1321815 RepID=A0ABN0NZ02_TRELE|nr:hypothetical protein HMPREF9193_00972 [Treponema lecithinolyticum ATCC 700332]
MHRNSNSAPLFRYSYIRTSFVIQIDYNLLKPVCQMCKIKLQKTRTPVFK